MSESISFYGGKSGISYRLIQHYDSIADMCAAFSKGGSYNEVGYGEYVIIDTIVNNNQKSNPQNGIIYRRGFNYTEDIAAAPVPSDYKDPTTGNLDPAAYKTAFTAYVLAPGAGAEYIGQIVGPQGETPELHIVKESEITDGATSGAGEIDSVAGDTQDNITYKYATLKDKDGNVYGCQLGITIPYYVLHLSAEEVSPYDAPAELAEQTVNRPFTGSWKISVPKGKHGADVNNLVVNKDDEEAQYFEVTRTNYENSEAGEEEITNIGAYRVIKDITPSNTNEPVTYQAAARSTSYAIGTITKNNTLPSGLLLMCIGSTNSDSRTAGTTSDSNLVLTNYAEGNKVIDGSVVWQVIKQNPLPPNLLTIDYTAGDDDTVNIRLLEGFSIDKDGSVYAKYTDINERTQVSTFKNIEDVYFDDQLQNLVIRYNTYNRDGSGNIVINDIPMLSPEGDVISYPTTDADGHNIEYIPTQIKFVKQMVIDDDGTIRIIYNTGDEDTLATTLKSVDNLSLNNDNFIVVTYSTKTNGVKDTVTLPLKLRTINEIGIKNKGDILQEQNLFANYNIGHTDSGGSVIGDETIISDNLNYVVNAKLYGDNLCILWSSPEYRDGLINYYELDADGKKNENAGAQLYRWENLGPILSGNHIIGHYTSLDALKAAYPSGFGTDAVTENRAGWVATVENGDMIELYAYDYIGNKGWYKIQDLSSTSVKPHLTMLVAKADSTGSKPDDADAAMLNDKGYWFVVSD